MTAPRRAPVRWLARWGRRPKAGLSKAGLSKAGLSKAGLSKAGLRRTQLQARPQPLRHREKVRPDEPRSRASSMSPKLRRAVDRVRAARPSRSARRLALRAVPRTRRSTQPPPRLRPSSRVVRYQASADPSLVRLAGAQLRPWRFPAMPVQHV